MPLDLPTALSLGTLIVGNLCIASCEGKRFTYAKYLCIRVGELLTSNYLDHPHCVHNSSMYRRAKAHRCVRNLGTLLTPLMKDLSRGYRPYRYLLHTQ
ncbi:hypothetical protein GGS21DRAFT_495378 [Xylaria nigripes]|nr:hypothetical protein GGS21DRAFT_495378 [Xylaria nigripes]